MADAACLMENVAFNYRDGGDVFRLDQLRVEPGETVLLTGESGAGKSTLLGLLCGVLAATTGDILVAGEAMSGRSGAVRDRLRADHIGYVFQSSNLIPYLSPVENVMLSGGFSKKRATAAGASSADQKKHAAELLEQLGVADLDRAASTLSVGQQQRVAAARALFGAPPLLVADEPSAALDHQNRDRFFEAVLSQTEKQKSGLLVVSHDLGVAKHFDRHLELASIARWEAA
ncbi:MAG: ATP-binding cassette domain-containing protein [Pseudomonadota bacterium]